MVIDDANVYFSSSSSVIAITKSGALLGSFTTANGQVVQALAVDANYVYATDDNGGIQKLTKTAASVALLRSAAGEASFGIASYGGSLFWSVYGSGWMDKSQTDGSSFAIEYSVPPQTNWHPMRVAADASGVYWTEYGANGRIMKSDLSFMNVAPLLSGHSYPVDIALDANNVYWINQGSNAIGKASKDGLSWQILTSVSLPPSGLAVDANYVYFGNAGAVSRVPVAGGSWVNIASSSVTPAEIAVDAQAIYWTNNNSGAGTVMKLAK